MCYFFRGWDCGNFNFLEYIGSWIYFIKIKNKEREGNREVKGLSGN